jgi:hypothetical protein
MDGKNWFMVNFNYIFSLIRRKEAQLHALYGQGE